ncbi:MAG: NAD+ synthase [Chloroflexi bacterium]|nr:NAD+ synthase [Chloroflexota bacterium]|tara:strand:+ start:3016 stop:4722 length:1707 start_codon:yes stop_codon:yes gene_type:complete
MSKFRISLAQINTSVGDLKLNTEKIISHIELAKSQKSELVIFPELSITGYPPEDLLLRPQFIQDNIRQLKKIISVTEKISVIIGFVDSKTNIYNAAALISNNNLIGVHHKILLPNYGVFDELRYFKPGKTPSIFRVNNIPLGINICEDIWHNHGPFIKQREMGAQVIININASPYEIGKKKIRESMLKERAQSNNIYIAYINLVGGQDELVFDGCSTVLNPKGEIIAQAKSFEEDFMTIDLNISTKNNLSKIEKIPANNLISKSIKNNNHYLSDSNEIKDLYESLVLGTKDYVTKCNFKKVIIAMSGGIDSSLVSTIATDALGKENVLGLSMPSRFNSKGSINDTNEIALNLGIKLKTIPIEEIFNHYEKILNKDIPNWQSNMVSENIQARIRANIIMALSNQKNLLILSTGNKSEIAIGYTTIYGDMVGGFSVIKDIYKTNVYKLAKYRNSLSKKNIIPQSIIERPPSAELRENQTDQDTLPKYSILDSILKAYIENESDINEIINQGYDRNTVVDVIKLVDKNEYKRRQSPPGIKVTSKNFGRDRRMPIANNYTKHIINNVSMRKK